MVFIMQKREVEALLRGDLGCENYLFALVYYLIMASIFVLLYEFGVLQAYISFLLTEKDFVLTVLFVASFGIFLMLALLQATTLSVRPLEELPPTDPAFLDQIAVIIPCHNSADCLADTLERALRHFRPDQIFVADNNRSPWPTDNAPLISEEFGVNYRYFPHPGKTNALFQIGAELLEEFNYFLLLDDDTLLPKHLSLDAGVFNSNRNVAGMGLGIRIKDRSCISQVLADWEYKCLSTRWSVVSQLAGTAKMAHGIAVLYRAEAFMIIYEKNPARTRLPFGEDGWSGMIARQEGMQIIQDAQNYVETFAPSRLFYNCRDLGWTSPSQQNQSSASASSTTPACILSKCWPGLNFRNAKNSDSAAPSTPTVASTPGSASLLHTPQAARQSNQISGYDATNMWKQRALRWYRNYPKRIHLEIGLCFTYDAGGLWRNIFYRLFFIYSVLLVYWSLSIPITLVTLSIGTTSSRLFGYYTVLVYLCGIGCTLLQNYVVFRRRPDLQFSSWKVPILFPLFTLYIAIMRCFGALGGILYYIPFRNFPSNGSRNKKQAQRRKSSRQISPSQTLSDDLDHTVGTLDSNDGTTDSLGISPSFMMHRRAKPSSSLRQFPFDWSPGSNVDDDYVGRANRRKYHTSPVSLDAIAKGSSLLTRGFGSGDAICLDEFDDIAPDLVNADSRCNSRNGRNRRNVTFSEIVEVAGEKPRVFHVTQQDGSVKQVFGSKKLSGAGDVGDDEDRPMGELHGILHASTANSVQDHASLGSALPMSPTAAASIVEARLEELSTVSSRYDIELPTSHQEASFSPPPDAVNAGSHDLIERLSQKHRRKESFWRLVRILVEVLRRYDPGLHAQANATIDDCVARYRQGDPCYFRLSSATKSRLKLVIPPSYWRLARQEQNCFMGRRLQRPTSASIAVLPSSSSMGRNMSTDPRHDRARCSATTIKPLSSRSMALVPGNRQDIHSRMEHAGENAIEVAIVSPSAAPAWKDDRRTHDRGDDGCHHVGDEESCKDHSNPWDASFESSSSHDVRSDLEMAEMETSGRSSSSNSSRTSYDGSHSESTDSDGDIFESDSADDSVADASRSSHFLQRLDAEADDASPGNAHHARRSDV